MLSTRCKRGLAITVCLLAIAAGAGAASAANLSYYGGPVAHSINVILVPWGANVRSTYTDPTTGDPAFFKYLASQSGSTSDIGGVLAQYMDATNQNSANRVTYGGSVPVSPSVGATGGGAEVQQSDLQSELQKDIAAGTLPAPSGNGLSTIYVVLFPPGDDVCFVGGPCSNDPQSGFCAFHGSVQMPTSSTQVLYAAMVDDGPNTPNFGFCGPKSAPDISNQTADVSHEFAETINDPLVSEARVLAAPLGWFDASGREIADACAASPHTINGPWSVVPLWSNRDQACVAGESSFAPPTASFTPPAGGLAGQAVGFSATASSDPSNDSTSALDIGTNPNQTFSITRGIAGYDWNWGDGTPDGTGATPAHAYAAQGAYTVTLTVTDKLGFTASVSKTVVIGTPPPAVTTGAASNISAQGATLGGTINPFGRSGTYSFAYGTSATALTSSTAATPTPAGTANTPVSATIGGLQPSTRYFYELAVTIGGKVTRGSVQSFATGPAAQPSPPPAPTPPPRTKAPPPPALTIGSTQLSTARPAARQVPVAGTGAVTALASRHAVLNGTVDPGGSAPVSYRFSYGRSRTGLSHTTATHSGLRGTTAVPVHIAVRGLVPRARYFFRIDAILNRVVHSGAVHAFTTRAPAAGVTTGRARAHRVTVTLNGTVRPNGYATRYHFELGRTKRYGRSSPTVSAGAGRHWRSVSALVARLRPHTLYHYRLVATGPGGTVMGADKTFRTGGRAIHAARVAVAGTSRQSLARALARGLRVSFRCSAACQVSGSALTAQTGPARAAAFAITVARGSASLHSSGSAQLTLRFTPEARRRLRGAGGIRLLVSAVAAPNGANPTAPALQYVALSR